jgi:hypothetical protein
MRVARRVLYRLHYMTPKPRTYALSARLATAGLLAIALAGCEPPAPAAKTTPAAATTSAAPSPGAANASIEAIDARADSIDRYAKRRPHALERYAQVTEDGPPVPVRDSTQWPDGTITRFNIFRDSTGTVLLHREMPTSDSGDWFAVISHYLAPDGRTIRHDFEISSFSSGCAEILRETRRRYFDLAFALLEDVRKYTDGNGKDLNATECDRRSDDAPPPKRGISELAVGQRSAGSGR